MFLGAAHGLSSILQILLSFPEHYQGKEDVESVIANSVNLMLDQEENDNYPPVLGQVKDDRDTLVHWCHGAPGVVYLMAKAYMTWKHDKFLYAALRCGDIVWQKGLLKKGPGICHGVAGMVYMSIIQCSVS